MKGALWLGMALLCSLALAADPLDRQILSADKVETKPGSIQGVLAKDESSEPTTTFTTNAAKIAVRWKGSGLHAGDKVRAVWLAEDVGIAAPKNSRITAGSVTAYKPDDYGTLAVSRPKGGWPPGQYRLELYLNTRLAQVVRFKIEPDVVVEVVHDGS